MHSGAVSSFWAIWGFVIWIIVLALPIITYLFIAELQRARRRRNEPTLTLGERLDRDSERLKKKDDQQNQAS